MNKYQKNIFFLLNVHTEMTNKQKKKTCPIFIEFLKEFSFIYLLLSQHMNNSTLPQAICVLAKSGIRR